MLTRTMLEDLWNDRLQTVQTMTTTLKDELRKVEQQLEQFLDRIANASVACALDS